MGPLSLLFTSLKRSNLFSYGLLDKQLTFIASKHNTQYYNFSARPPQNNNACASLRPGQNKKSGSAVSVASRIRRSWFLKVFSTNIYLHLLTTLCSQFCRCPLSNRGDKFSNLLSVKGTGCFSKVPYNLQTHHAMSWFLINILSIPRRSFGNFAKSTFSAFTTDDGIKLRLTMALSSVLTGLPVVRVTQKFAKCSLTQNAC